MDKEEKIKLINDFWNNEELQNAIEYYGEWNNEELYKVKDKILSELVS